MCDVLVIHATLKVEMNCLRVIDITTKAKRSKHGWAVQIGSEDYTQEIITVVQSNAVSNSRTNVDIQGYGNTEYVQQGQIWQKMLHRLYQ